MPIFYTHPSYYKRVRKLNGRITVSTEKNGEEGGHRGREKEPLLCVALSRAQRYFSGNGPEQAKQSEGNRGHFQKNIAALCY